VTDIAEMHEQSRQAFNMGEQGVEYYRAANGSLYELSGAVAKRVEEAQQGVERPDDEEVRQRAQAALARLQAPTDGVLVEQARSVEPERRETITEKSLLLNKNFIHAAALSHELFEGKPFEGTASEAVQYGLDVMGEFAFNFFGVPGYQPAGTEGGEFSGGGMIAQAATIVNSGTPEQAQAFLYMLGEYEKLPTFTQAGMSRMFRGLANDPATAGSLVAAGVPSLFKLIGQRGAAMTTRKMLQSVAANPGKYGAGAGAVYGAGGEEALMQVEETQGREIGAGERAARLGVGTAVGGTAGAALGKGAEALMPVVGEAIGAMGAPAVNAVGDAIQAAGEQAQRQLDEGGTKLMSGPDLDTPVNKVVAAAGEAVKAMRGGADDVQLTDAERAGTLIDELYGEGTIEPGGNLYDVAKKLNEKSKAGGDRSEQTVENQDAIARMMAAEIQQAMRVKGNAGDWYKTKIANAMSIAARIYPELADDPVAASSFKFIMAITSNGADVASNVVNTVKAYDIYRQTGKMPIVGYGRETPSMEFAFRLFNELEEKLGSREEVFKLLNTKMQVRDLKKIGEEYGFGISGENMDTEMPASVMFGPKIGGAFYQNLEGNMDMLTMDRWFMRMWGRMSGTLIPERSPATLAKQQSRARNAVTPELAEQYGFVYDDIMNDDTVLSDFASAVHKKFAAGGFKDKSEFTRSMKALDEGGSKVLETPAGGGHRTYMRGAIDKAVQILRDAGIETDPASAQALLWYPEKELYGKLGVGNKKSAPTDYEAELAKLAQERGIDVSDITGQP